MNLPDHIVQIAPRIARGSGVAGVAFELERQFIDAGVHVERFTLAEARPARPRFSGMFRLRHAWDVLWFSTVGTWRARRFLAARPDAVSICHNDAMVGDIYVNHGIVQAAMHARGNSLWRVVRNPLHMFTIVRDRIRYRSRTHRTVVALSGTEARLLERTYGRLGAPVVVIPNGVNLDRFSPPTEDERATARDRLGVSDDTRIAVFIGHEFERKGLPLVLEALTQLPSTLLVVVGGSKESIDSAVRTAQRAGVADRVLFAGTTDPVPFLHAADVFTLPSAYESSGLVYLEALASGVPVIATPVGVAAELISNGENGFIVDRDSDQIAQRLRDIAELDQRTLRAAARASVAHLAWGRIAETYRSVLAMRGGDGGPLRIVHAVRSDGYSGVERFIARLARAQAAAGHHVRVIGGDPVKMRNELSGTGIPFAAARSTAQVSRALRSVSDRTDVVNTHMTAAELAAVRAFVGRADRPTVVTTRHFGRPRRRIGPLRMDAVTSLVLDAEIAISEAVAATIAVPSTVVHTGLDPSPAENLVAAYQRRKVVLIAQRLYAEKRTADGLSAFARSGLAAQGWVLHIAGRGPDIPLLLTMAEEEGVAEATEFIGHRDDLDDLMRRAGILLAPCDVEGLGLTVMEAMRAGLPVVAADAGGHRDLLAGENEPSLYPRGDLDAAAEILRLLAEDHAERDRRARAAHARQSAFFSTDRHLSGTDGVYRTAMARRRR